MRQKKKCNNKQNAFPLHKATIQHINYTEELRLPTSGTTDLRQLIKSTQLKKMPNKKSTSRKLRCLSVKQQQQKQTMRMKQFLKQFKSLKAMAERQKSPSSCNSKSKRKKSKSKFNYSLGTNPHSQKNLTLKLEKTLKKLNQTGYFKEFKDEDQLVQLESSVDPQSTLKKYTEMYSISENIEEVDIQQIRFFSEQGDTGFKKSIQFFKGDIYEIMATRIQKAWRSYCTNKLVNRYIKQFKNFNLEQNDNTNSEPLSSQYEQRQDIMIQTQQFYQKQNNRKITYISDLQQQAQELPNSGRYDQAVKMLKIQELSKWNQIISIISHHIGDNQNPDNMSELLNVLAQQSQINKKDLEKKALKLKEQYSNSNSVRVKETKQKKQYQDQQEQIQNFRQNAASQSDSSQVPREQFNSKKYIEYLQYGDMYPIKRQSKKISSKQKEELLNELISEKYPIKLGQSSLYKSQSEKVLKLKEHYEGLICHNKNLQKSISQRHLRKTMQNISPLAMNLDEEQINIEMLRKQFLEGSDPLQNLHSEQMLKIKLAELNRIKQQPESQQDIKENKSDEDDQFIRPSLSRQQKILPLHKINMQTIDNNIVDLDEQQSEQSKNQKLEQTQHISAMIFNGLIFEVLKQMAKHQATILVEFKKYALTLKTKNKNIQRAKKKGFKTNQAQIKQFVDGLTAHLLSQEPHVFKNLEVATGPTAIQMLKYMHQTSEQQMNIDEDEDDSSVMVIPNRIFDSYWVIKQKGINQISEEERQRQKFQFMKGLNKVFYRSLFDGYNECLDYERNYGQFGKPFPWKRAASFYHSLTLDEIKNSIENAQKRMVDITSTYCGIIVQKQDMNQLCGNETYLQQVQQDRLSRMLAQDLIDGEQRWVFYDDQQTQILVELGSLIALEIMLELVEEIMVIFR